MRQFLKRLSAALLVVAGIALIVLLTDAIERGMDALIERIGAVWTLGLLSVAIVVLAGLWLRYGGTRVLRRWGVVLKPARPEEGASGSDAGSDSERSPRLVGPRK